MSKINILRIISAHFDSLRDASTGKHSISDVILFFGAPLLAAAMGWYLGWGLYVDALNAVLAAFAIFAGLLLNLLLLIYTFSTDANHPVALAKLRLAFVRELHNNIAFAILVSIGIVVVAMVAIGDLKMVAPEQPAHTGRVITAILLYLIVNFVLTLLMILKRIHVMMGQELDKPKIRKVS